MSAGNIIGLCAAGIAFSLIGLWGFGADIEKLWYRKLEERRDWRIKYARKDRKEWEKKRAREERARRQNNQHQAE
jgi:hypothetical protein